MSLTYIPTDHKQPQHRLAKACARAAARIALATPLTPFSDTWSSARLDNWAIAVTAPAAYPRTILHDTCNTSLITRLTDEGDTHCHHIPTAQHTTGAQHPSTTRPPPHNTTIPNDAPPPPEAAPVQQAVNVVTYNARTLTNAEGDQNRAATTPPPLHHHRRVAGAEQGRHRRYSRDTSPPRSSVTSASLQRRHYCRHCG